MTTLRVLMHWWGRGFDSPSTAYVPNMTFGAFKLVECHNEIKHFYTQTLPKVTTIIPIHKQLRLTSNSFYKIKLGDICIINSKYFTHLKVISQLKA